MALDPKAQRFLEQLAAQAAAAGPQPKLAEIPSESVRRMLNEILLTLDSPPEAVARVDEFKIPGPAGSIPARMYRRVEKVRSLRSSTFTGEDGSSATWTRTTPAAAR